MYNGSFHGGSRWASGNNEDEEQVTGPGSYEYESVMSFFSNTTPVYTGTNITPAYTNAASVPYNPLQPFQAVDLPPKPPPAASANRADANISRGTAVPFQDDGHMVMSGVPPIGPGAPPPPPPLSEQTTAPLVPKSDKELSCPVRNCHIFVKDSAALTKHLMDKHKDHRMFVCPKCDARLSSKSSLRVHMRSHSGSRPHQCRFCTKSFTTLSGLKRHELTHSDSRPYKCDFPGCGASFRQRSHLKDHKNIHELKKPFTCPYPGCGKAFRKSSGRVRHLRICKKGAAQRAAEAAANESSGTSPMLFPPPPPPMS